MIVIARLEYELAYYDSAVHRFSHYTTRTPPYNCDSCYSHQRMIKGTGRNRNKRMSGDHPNYCIIEIGQNREESRRLEEISCHQNFSERPSTNADVKTLIVIITIIIKSGYGLNWLPQGLRYGPSKLNNALSQKELDIRRNHKVYRENQGKLESAIDSRRKTFVEVDIQRGILQGDELSPLLFVIVMVQPNHILRKCTGGYKLSKSQEKLNHQIYMDDIKLFAKKGK